MSMRDKIEQVAMKENLFPELECIYRDLLINELTNLGWDDTSVVDIVKEFPSADVAPVRHERWEIVVGSDGKEHMVCTGCRKQQDLTGVFSYCPNCGAKMDLED